MDSAGERPRLFPTEFSVPYKVQSGKLDNVCSVFYIPLVIPANCRAHVKIDLAIWLHTLKFEPGQRRRTQTRLATKVAAPTDVFPFWSDTRAELPSVLTAFLIYGSAI
jgi:hypothetical protein